MIKNPLLHLSLCIFIAGCAGAPSERFTRSMKSYNKTSERINLPKINEVTTVELGGSLISDLYLYKDPAIEVTEPFSMETSNVGTNFTISISPGDFFVKGADENGFFYQSATSKLRANNLPVNKIIFGVYVTKYDPEITEIYTMTDDGRPLIYPAPNLKIRKYTKESISATEFKKELVYTGISKNIINISYREYSNGIARPAFTQELKYDISEGKVFGFRDARFEIIKATNTGITYRAISHLTESH